MRRQRFFKEADDNEKCNFTAHENAQISNFHFSTTRQLLIDTFASARQPRYEAQHYFSTSSMTHIIKTRQHFDTPFKITVYWNNQREMITLIFKVKNQFFFRPNRLCVTSDSFLLHRKRDKARSSHTKPQLQIVFCISANVKLQRRAVQKLYEKHVPKYFGKNPLSYNDT